MTINEKIDEIISARKSKIKNIKKTIENLSSVKNSIERFEDFRDDLEDDNSFANIKNIDVQKLKDDCEKINGELERLEKRFSRDRVHLTFVGEMGSGKSLVMQRISGLDDKIIPSSKGRSCTGAKSIITNSENEEDVEAHITFFTEKEIVNIVNDYLETVYEGRISKVNSINDIKKKFSSKSLDDDEFTKIESKFAVNKDKKTYLEKYIYHIDDFKEYLGQASKTVNRDDIAKYVAQYKIGDIDKEYYNFLAVKEANIKCHFPSTDCSKIVLVDTVGLGETSLKVKEKMLETVKNDSDAILYLFFPRIDRTEMKSECSEIVDNIIEQLGEEYTRKMLFWVLNERKDGEEEYKKIIPKLMTEVSKKNWAISKALKVNCNDEDDVRKNLLEPILTQISENLEDIDNILISNTQKKIDKLFKDYTSFVEKVEKGSEKFIDQDIDDLFREKIDKTFGYWTGLLRDYCRDLSDDRDDKNEELQNDFEIKLSKILEDIPTIEKIQEQLKYGYKRPQNVYEEFIDLIRIKTINNFLELDKTLSKSVKKMKDFIVHILADDDKGKFEHILPICDNPDDWLKDFLGKIGEEKRFKDISLAIKTLRNFRLTTKNYLIHEVRNSLDSMDPIIVGLPKIEGYDEEELAKNIREYIYDACEEVKREIEENCSDYIQFENKALWATARDFYDRVAFSINLSNDYIVDMKERWRGFYKKYISEIWSEEYNSHKNTIEISKDFDSIKESLVSLGNEKNFKIN